MRVRGRVRPPLTLTLTKAAGAAGTGKAAGAWSPIGRDGEVGDRTGRVVPHRVPHGDLLERAHAVASLPLRVDIEDGEGVVCHLVMVRVRVRARVRVWVRVRVRARFMVRGRVRGRVRVKVRVRVMVTACLRDPATTMPQAQRGGSSSDGGEGAKDQVRAPEGNRTPTLTRASSLASIPNSRPNPHRSPWPQP